MPKRSLLLTAVLLVAICSCSFALTIKGVITINGTSSPLEGVSVVASGGSQGSTTAFSNSAGAFTCNHTACNPFTVTPSKTGYAFNPPFQAFALTKSVTGINFTASLKPAISGRIDSLQGVKLTGLPGDPLTDANGFYFAYVDPNWSGSVTPQLPGFVFSPADRSYSNINQNVPDQNYSPQPVTSYTISGIVGNLSDVTLLGFPAGPVVTSSDGSFSAVVNTGWSGTIIPTKQGFTFTPAQLVFSDVNSNLTEQYFYPDPTVTSYPTPQDGFKFTKNSLQLKWTPGNLAVSYNLYLGTSFEAVSDADTTSFLCKSKNLTDTRFLFIGLNYNKTYYWRVDQNYTGASPDFPSGPSGTLKGSVWSFTTLPSPPLDPNLVGWWKFDDPNAALAWDYSGNGHTGFFLRDAKIVNDPQLGYALSLDGDDYVSIVGYKGILGSHSRSMSAWVKPAKFASAILSFGIDTPGNKWECQIDPSGYLRQGIESAYVNSTTQINDGQWHHVTVIFDSSGSSMLSQCKLFIDGQPEAFSTVVDKLVNTIAGYDVAIGRCFGKDYFAGLIKDVRLFDCAIPFDPYIPCPNFISIDNMEEYNDITKPINHLGGWQDNTFNINVGGDASIGFSPYIHGGTQSLKLRYDNIDLDLKMYFCSEIVKVFDTPQDWTYHTTAMKILSIPFRGQPSNDNDKLYVALEDQDQNSAIIYYNSGAIADFKNTNWQTWQIDLNSFKLSNSQLDLSKIKKFFIGVGTRYTQDLPYDRIDGTLYFDDITLNKPYCRPDILKQIGDINNDCTVNFADIRTMADNWLAQDTVIALENPSDANLLVRYTFDQNNASDSSGNNNNGTMFNVTTIPDPNINKETVARFNGATSYISVPVSLFGSISDQITISFWAFGDQNIAANSVFYGDTGPISPARIFNAHIPWIMPDSSYYIFFDAGNAPGSEFLNYDRISAPITPDLYKGKWNHWAFTKNNALGQMKIYCNGLLFLSGSGKTKTMAGVQRFDIGRNPVNNQNSYFKGLIDDFRIYDAQLSNGQVLALAGFTQAAVIPIDPLTNLKAAGTPGQEIIDYGDFSILAKTWMQTTLWP